MKFALAACLAISCLSSVLSGPLADPDNLALLSRDPILNNYCNYIAITGVINIQTLPQIMRPLSCIATSLIDELCLTNFAEEFCTNPLNPDEGGNDGVDYEDFENDDTGDDEAQVSTPGTDAEDPDITIATTLTPDDVEANPTGDDETPGTDVEDPTTTITTTLTSGDVGGNPIGDDETPGNDVEDPNTSITTTITPGDVETNPNTNAKSKPVTKSKSSKKSKGSNKKSKNGKGYSKEFHHAKSKGKKAHAKSKSNSATKSKRHNVTKNKN